MGTTWALVRFYWGYGALVGLLWAVCRMAVGKVKSHENSTVSRNRAIGIKWQNNQFFCLAVLDMTHIAWPRTC